MPDYYIPNGSLAVHETLTGLSLTGSLKFSHANKLLKIH